MKKRRFVSVARYGTPEEAEIARLALESQDVRCMLGTETTAGWFWFWGSAIAGVRIQVAEDDWATRYPGDATATRAWRAAIFGLVFLPVIFHAYSSIVLLTLVFRDAKLSLAGCWKVVGAFLIDLAVAGLVGAFIAVVSR